MKTITGHQPNLLPGSSVMEKMRRADEFIVCDTFDYTRHSFCNRNRLTAGGPWFTVPVNEHDTFVPMRDARIADPTGRAREKVAKALENRLGFYASPYAEELRRPYRMLLTLNMRLLRLLADDLRIETPWHMQSHLESCRGVLDVSERLAMMVSELGGDVWLSGPTGRTYLRREPFDARGIRVEFFDWPKDRPNPSAITLVPIARDLTLAARALVAA